MTGRRLDLSAAQRALVSGILRAHLPADSCVWVFGSRATGRAKRFSDLDLAIDAGRKLTLDETAALREALAESDLPWKVDLVDLTDVDPGFARNIESERTLFPFADQS